MSVQFASFNRLPADSRQPAIPDSRTLRPSRPFVVENPSRPKLSSLETRSHPIPHYPPGHAGPGGRAGGRPDPAHARPDLHGQRVQGGKAGGHSLEQEGAVLLRAGGTSRRKSGQGSGAPRRGNGREDNRRVRPVPDSERREETAERGQFRVLTRRVPGAAVCQHPEGLAAQHARRLLGDGSGAAESAQAGRRCGDLDADVRQVLARRRPRGLCAQEQPVSAEPRGSEDHRAHQGWLGDTHQRHLRLGERGGTGTARRVPLESGWFAHRVLAVRHQRREALLAGEPDRGQLPALHHLSLP